MLTPPDLRSGHAVADDDRRRTELARHLSRACELDVMALKPGNVGIDSPGHGMSADDFLVSAAAIAEPMTRPGLTVGERIVACIAATRSAVGCNTNLGIVLLCAPLTHAALERTRQPFRQALGDCLAQLTTGDAVNAYAAIRLAQPAGLGKRAAHDVAEVPTITLRQAMTEAQHEDMIARQYANGYADLFDCQPTIGQLRRRWNDDRWTATAVYLALLAHNPDTHVARKFGLDTALRISHQAHALARAVLHAADPVELLPELHSMDGRLKSAGINPGTSADLTVAAMYLHGILSMEQKELTASEAIPLPLVTQPWDPSRIPAN